MAAWLRSEYRQQNGWLKSRWVRPHKTPVRTRRVIDTGPLAIITLTQQMASDTQAALRTSRSLAEPEITDAMIEAAGAELLKWFPDSGSRDYCRSLARDALFAAMQARERA